MDFMGYSVSEIRQSLIAIGLPSDCHLIAI
jgi:hypothetical protein